VSKIVREAEEITRASQVDNVLVVAKEGWNEGVLRIVASRLVRKYDRPAIVLTIESDQGVAKGSARSITPFNLFENCMRIKDLFTQFGGHAQAAGKIGRASCRERVWGTVDAVGLEDKRLRESGAEEER